MRRARRDNPTKAFGFAIAERDWPLAGLLALAAGTELGLLAGMRWELEERMPSDEPRITLGSLRALGHLLRALAHLERRG